MSRYGFCGVVIAAMVVLAACAPARASSTDAEGTRPSVPSASPNITALQDAGAGQLQQPAFVEFYSDDCAICRRIQGPMRTLDLNYEGRVKFIYIDIDLPESQPFVRQYDVRGIPMFILLSRRGDTVGTMPGWPGQDAVAASLDGILLPK